MYNAKYFMPNQESIRKPLEEIRKRESIVRDPKAREMMEQLKEEKKKRENNIS